MSGEPRDEKAELAVERIFSAKEGESELAGELAGFIYTGSSLRLPNPANLIRSHPVWD